VRPDLPQVGILSFQLKKVAWLILAFRQICATSILSFPV
jgi:hypothetical protein